MLEKKLVLSRIEIERDGVMFVRWNRYLVEDGDTASALLIGHHSSTITPEDDAEQLIANTDVALGKDKPEAGEWDRVRAAIAFAQPADVKASYIEKMDAVRGRAAEAAMESPDERSASQEPGGAVAA